jgi:predicted small lipoprotein YifL
MTRLLVALALLAIAIACGVKGPPVRSVDATRTEGSGEPNQVETESEEQEETSP